MWQGDRHEEDAPVTGLISPNRLARVASLAYLVVIVAGGWSELVVRGPLAVEGDAADLHKELGT